uniref:Putative secreted protein n=1 Tax=Ixodes ricinus TaxID=34613 RepID=A0A6B0UM13_IXORI
MAMKVRWHVLLIQTILRTMRGRSGCCARLPPSWQSPWTWQQLSGVRASVLSSCPLPRARALAIPRPLLFSFFPPCARNEMPACCYSVWSPQHRLAVAWGPAQSSLGVLELPSGASEA